MDWQNLIINIIGIFAGLAIYIIVMNTKWGEEHADFQYAIMLVSILAACIVGGVLRWVF